MLTTKSQVPPTHTPLLLLLCYPAIHLASTVRLSLPPTALLPLVTLNCPFLPTSTTTLLHRASSANPCPLHWHQPSTAFLRYNKFNALDPSDPLPRPFFVDQHRSFTTAIAALSVFWDPPGTEEGDAPMFAIKNRKPHTLSFANESLHTIRSEHGHSSQQLLESLMLSTINLLSTSFC